MLDIDPLQRLHRQLGNGLIKKLRFCQDLKEFLNQNGFDIQVKMLTGLCQHFSTNVLHFQDQVKYSVNHIVFKFEWFTPV